MQIFLSFFLFFFCRVHWLGRSCQLPRRLSPGSAGRQSQEGTGRERNEICINRVGGEIMERIPVIIKPPELGVCFLPHSQMDNIMELTKPAVWNNKLKCCSGFAFIGHVRVLSRVVFIFLPVLILFPSLFDSFYLCIDSLLWSLKLNGSAAWYHWKWAASDSLCQVQTFWLHFKEASNTPCVWSAGASWQQLWDSLVVVFWGLALTHSVMCHR